MDIVQYVGFGNVLLNQEIDKQACDIIGQNAAMANGEMGDVKMYHVEEVGHDTLGGHGFTL